MKKSQTVLVRCSCCQGSGKVPLTGEYMTTLKDVQTHGGEVTAAELARLTGVKATAMSNRLAALERHGLLTSRRFGKKRLFTMKGVA